MLRVERVGEDYEVSIRARPPLIYLDHWAVRKLSKPGPERERFNAAFEHRGTLMFSLMNVVEIARDASRERAADIRSLLEDVGAHWAPMTVDPMRILEAEEVGDHEGGVHPCISEAFLGDPEFRQRLVEEGASLAHCVDLTRAAAGRAVKSASGDQEAEMLRNLQEWRDGHEHDPSELDRKFPEVAFDSKRPMRTIYNGIARLTIRDTFRLDANHIRDLFHALAAVRCANMVTLDRHWAGQVRKLRLPHDFVRVYSEVTFEQFLVDLENEVPPVP